jgi:hypothetical protein
MKTIDGQHRVGRDPYAAWCLKLFSSLVDQGLWGVPRSGLTFQRQGNRLVLIERAEGFSAADQQADFEATKRHFGLAFIEVTDATMKRRHE